MISSCDSASLIARSTATRWVKCSACLKSRSMTFTFLSACCREPHGLVTEPLTPTPSTPLRVCAMQVRPQPDDAGANLQLVRGATGGGARSGPRYAKHDVVKARRVYFCCGGDTSSYGRATKHLTSLMVSHRAHLPSKPCNVGRLVEAILAKRTPRGQVYLRQRRRAELLAAESVNNSGRIEGFPSSANHAPTHT
mgnify:CR=1 FL=1